VPGPSRADTLLPLADDELIVGWRNSEWTGIAPFLEEDVAFSSIAQNEIGHARALYEIVAE
jgi:ring-1,2-phenylacetyl-CoA epoxidase subunit PaaC